jgi:hypothetical protein
VPEQDPLPTSSSHQGVLSRIATRNLEYRESLSKAERETVERAIAALLSIKQGDASKEVGFLVQKKTLKKNTHAPLVPSLQYPVPTSILQPEANPIYYTRLADMLTKATKGERVGITFAQRIRLFFGRPI